MTTATWDNASGTSRAHSLHGSVWMEVNAWIALLPTLLITVSGWIQTESAPVAFRFTAMAEDSLARRVTRLGCSGVIFLLIATRPREIMSVCHKTRVFVILPALAFVSVFWSQNPTHTLVDAVNLALTTLFAIYLYVRYPGQRLITFLTFAAMIALLLCAFTVAFVPSVGIDAFQQGAWRGIFGQRNNCAVICTCFFVLGLQYQARTFLEHVFRGALLLLATVFIVMSGSRTGWALTGFGIGLTLGLRLMHRIRAVDRLAVLMVVAIPSVICALLVATHFNQTLAMMDKDPTMTQRTVIWSEVLPSIAKHPLRGYGYSSFWTGLKGESMHAVLVTGWMEGQAQNGYLDVVLQLGMLGAVALAWMFARGLSQATRCFRTERDVNVLHLAIVLLPIILADNIGETSFLLPLSIPWFYALIAILILDSSAEQMEVC